MGTYEGIHSGVPMIITPIYGDQFINARAVAERQAGVYLPFDDLVDTNVQQAFQRILTPE